MSKKGTREEWFWQKVDKTSGCWLWTGALNAKGYGVFGVAPGRSGLAHAYS